MSRRILLLLLTALLSAPSSLLPAADVPPASLAYVLQPERLGRTREAAVTKLANCGREWIVTDPSYDGSEEGRWAPEELDAIRQGLPGRRLLAYLSIGEAEIYRDYWQPSWDANRDGHPDKNAPKFLLDENPDWEGNYKVRYWQEEWQQIILAELARLVAQGFDGVYLDIVDAYEFFEYDPKKRDWIDNRKNSETGQSYRLDMIDWVGCIAEAGRSVSPGFLVIPQNGEQLLDDDGYRDLIDGIGSEDVFTDGNKKQSAKNVKYRVGFLAQLSADDKPVLLIEYPTKQRFKDIAIDGARPKRWLLLITDRNLTTLGKSY